MKLKTKSLLVAVALSVGVSFAASGASVNKCIAVGTTATPIFTPNPNRVSYSLWTTSGAGTFFFNDAGGTPKVPADANSMPVTGGLSYTFDSSHPYTGAILVVGKSGAANWICGKEN